MSRPPLKKRFGQHHLRDGRLCRPLLDYLRPGGQRVLEIGPGGGVLTAELLAAGAFVVAWEIDLEWAFALRRRLTDARLGVVAADALGIDYRLFPAPTLVAGNLPFNVATPLVAALLPHHAVVPRAAIMVQKEVAERLVAGPGEAAYGALSILVAARAKARYLGTVRPGSFQPPPKVAAAFVGLEPQPPVVAEAEMPELERLVHLAFGQRRKTLRNALASGLGRERATRLLDVAGIDGNRRAETLELAEYVALHRVLKGSQST